MARVGRRGRGASRRHRGGRKRRRRVGIGRVTSRGAAQTPSARSIRRRARRRVASALGRRLRVRQRFAEDRRARRNRPRRPRNSLGLRSKTRQSHRARVLPRARDARGRLSPRRGHQRRGGSGVSAVGRTGTGKEATRGKARRDRDAPTRRRPDHRARVLTGWERHRRRWTRSVRQLARGGDAPRVPGRVGHWAGAAGYRLGSAGAVQGALEHRG